MGSASYLGMECWQHFLGRRMSNEKNIKLHGFKLKAYFFPNNHKYGFSIAVRLTWKGLVV
jgi:hypothetical protein